MLCAGLASCEMKEELIGGGEKEYTETGLLELGVAVNAKQNTVTTKADTKADGDIVDEGEIGGTAVSADDFPIIIKGTVEEDGEAYEDSIPSYEDVKESAIVLPVGQYAITAHSNLKLENQMSEPYYEGINNRIIITKDATVNTDIVCRMKNTKIQMDYSDAFLAQFDSWTITMTDGKTNLYFSEQDKSPKAVYWLIADTQSSTITVDFNGKNTDGETILEQRVLTKPEGGNTVYWTGGDALNITIDKVEETGDPTGGIIKIDVDVTFDETNETIQVPVTPGTDPEEPTDPEPEEPTGPDEPSGDESDLSMTLPGTDGNITYTLNGSDMPAEANVVINAPKGMKSLIVKIVGGNEDFATTLDDLNTGDEMSLDFLNEGVEMVDNEIISLVLATFLDGQVINAPTKNATSYSFPIHAFFTLMNKFGATAPKSHVFTMILEDNAGGRMDKSLSVTINPAN